MDNRVEYINAIAEMVLTMVRTASMNLTDDEFKDLVLKLFYAINTVLDENKIMER